MSTSQQRGQGWRMPRMPAADREILETKIEALAALGDERDKRYTAQRIDDARAVEVGFQAQTTAMQTALTTQKLAVDKAEAATEKRFESVNEFRAQLADLIRTFMPRTESTALINAVDARLTAITATYEDKLSTMRGDISTLQRTISSQQGGKASTRELLSYAITLAAILAALIRTFIK